MSMTFQTETVSLGKVKTSAVFEIHGARHVIVLTPAAIEGASVSYLGATSRTGTFSAVVGATGLTKGSWQSVPSTCIGLHSLKMVLASAQTTARTVVVCKHS